MRQHKHLSLLGLWVENCLGRVLAQLGLMASLEIIVFGARLYLLPERPMEDAPRPLQKAVGLLHGVGVHPQPGGQRPPGGQLVPGADGPRRQPPLEIANDLLIDGPAVPQAQSVKGHHIPPPPSAVSQTVLAL